MNIEEREVYSLFTHRTILPGRTVRSLACPAGREACMSARTPPSLSTSPEKRRKNDVAKLY